MSLPIKPHAPTVMSLAQLKLWAPPKMDYVIADGILYVGTSGFIYGPSKSWKSIETIHIATSVASGRIWYGHRTNQCAVLIHQTEIPQFLFKKRVMKFCLHYGHYPDHTLFFMSQNYLKLDSPYGMAEICRALDYIQTAQPGLHILLIIDPLYDAMTGNINESQDVQRLLDNLNVIKKKYSCTILIVHHASKRQFANDGSCIDRGADSIHGSAYLRNWCDIAISMELTNPPPGAANNVAYRFELVRHAETLLSGFNVTWHRDTLQPELMQIFEPVSADELLSEISVRRFES